MLLTGLLLVLIAAVLHGWYSGNAMAKPGNAAFAFRSVGGLALGLSIGLLIGGVLLVWAGAGFVAVLITLPVYFFLLPLIVVPILTAGGFVPDRRARYTREERKLERGDD